MKLVSFEIKADNSVFKFLKGGTSNYEFTLIYAKSVQKAEIPATMSKFMERSDQQHGLVPILQKRPTLILFNKIQNMDPSGNYGEITYNVFLYDGHKPTLAMTSGFAYSPNTTHDYMQNPQPLAILMFYSCIKHEKSPFDEPLF